jgi:hypothetical protein
MAPVAGARPPRGLLLRPLPLRPHGPAQPGGRGDRPSAAPPLLSPALPLSSSLSLSLSLSLPLLPSLLLSLPLPLPLPLPLSLSLSLSLSLPLPPPLWPSPAASPSPAPLLAPSPAAPYPSPWTHPPPSKRGNLRPGGAGAPQAERGARARRGGAAPGTQNAGPSPGGRPRPRESEHAHLQSPDGHRSQGPHSKGTGRAWPGEPKAPSGCHRVPATQGSRRNGPNTPNSAVARPKESPGRGARSHAVLLPLRSFFTKPYKTLFGCLRVWRAGTHAVALNLKDQLCKLYCRLRRP